MLFDKFKNMPEEEKEEKKKFLNTLIGAVLYFVILNNPKKAGIIKVFMKIFGIPEDIFYEIDEVLSETENTAEPSDQV